jgi:hypothetical protein
MNPQLYLKAIVSVVVAVLGVVVVALSDGHIDSVEWLNIVMGLLTAIGVYYTPNIPGAPIAKLVVAALLAGGTVAANFVIASTQLSGITTTQWVMIALALVNALAVYLVPNALPKAKSAAAISGNL